ncbi:type I-D CRISPR-associated helicase Cas3' [Candidatus Marsarchaeota G2 archaeon ECH_B_SAG-C16]|uniref:Type I-D CRISPR-associated helicase Cas3 n=1 Tax=Candidatus Marsarchaeota G2 archaeon ECH_B_SAG-C16 TaxID=1978163 RepID=A0A2R6BD44_9ARCH|nr:MAG: type I-D CRISPR-associated helicase Cas3' [Candidatus Marsarchaeota G2 archaeon ECH_B_SAG-C16]
MIKIDSYRIERSDENLSGITLRKFQSDVLRSTSPLIVLDAPTGSGKTLAYLAKALKENFGSTVIVYPTNALIFDQLSSIQRLLSALGKKSVLKTPIPDEIFEDTGSGDVSLYVVNGETLNTLAKNSNTTEGRTWLSVLRKDDSPQRVFLTNPEVLYFLFLLRFSKSNELVDSILKPNERHMLVLDEFHLYYGYSLATIYFMLMYIRNRIDQFIFSSATTTVLPDFLGEPERISAAPSPYGDTIQHELEFSFQGMSGSTLSTDDIRELSGLVERAYEQSGKRGKADVVVILNSVLTAYWLARELENKYPGLVSEIHGLVPQGERPKPQELRSLVVGTSAVEVGVDFDTGFLIFEANNVGSFIQRLGRGGRHSPCRVIAVIPSLLCESFRRQLGDGETISRVQLLDSVRNTFSSLPLYSDFLSTQGANLVLLSVLASWVFKAYDKITIKECVDSLTRSLREDRYILPEGLVSRRDELLRTLQREDFGGIIRALGKQMSVRSTLSTLPAFFDLRERSGFDFISLDDLSKVMFSIKSRKEVKRLAKERGKKLPLRFSEYEKIVIVNKVLDRSEKTCISVDKDEYSSEPRPLYSFWVQTLNNSEPYKELLKSQPAFLVDERSDWRLAGLRVCRGGYLILGGDALVAWSANR